MKIESVDDESESNVEYVPEQLALQDSVFDGFVDVFARFQLPNEATTVRSHPRIVDYDD